VPNIPPATETEQPVQDNQPVAAAAAESSAKLPTSEFSGEEATAEAAALAVATVDDDKSA